MVLGLDGRVCWRRQAGDGRIARLWGHAEIKGMLVFGIRRAWAHSESGNTLGPGTRRVWGAWGQVEPGTVRNCGCAEKRGSAWLFSWTTRTWTVWVLGLNRQAVLLRDWQTGTWPHPRGWQQTERVHTWTYLFGTGAAGLCARLEVLPSLVMVTAGKLAEDVTERICAGKVLTCQRAGVGSRRGRQRGIWRE